MIKRYTVIPHDTQYDEPHKGDIIELRILSAEDNLETISFHVTAAISGQGALNRFRVEGFKTADRSVGVIGSYKIQETSEKLGIVYVYEPE